MSSRDIEPAAAVICGDCSIPLELLRATLRPIHTDDLGRRSRLLVNACKGKVAGRNLENTLGHNSETDIDTLWAVFGCHRTLTCKCYERAICARQQVTAIDTDDYCLATAFRYAPKERLNGQPIVPSISGGTPRSEERRVG